MMWQDVTYAIVAILASPCLIALYVHLWGYWFRWSWGMVIIMMTFTASFLTWNMIRRVTWPLQDKPKTVRIPGCTLGACCASAIFTFYAAVGCGAPVKVLECIFNFIVISSIASALHLSFARAFWLPFIMQILLLPMLTSDRMPMPGQPHWPSWLHHASMSVTFVWAVLASLQSAIRITLALKPSDEAVREQGKQPRERVLHVHYESIAIACAFWSMAYLVALAIQELADIEGYPRVSRVACVAYHISWSFLRPSYVTLFAVYWLKRLPYYQHLQAAICGMGFFFFLVLAPLSETHKSHMYGTTFASDDGYTHLGHAAHRTEAACFYASWMLFFVHGVASGSWQESCAGRLCGLRVFVKAIMVVACCFVVVLEVGHILKGEVEVAEWLNNRARQHFIVAGDSFFFWCFIHYNLGYGLIVVIASYILLANNGRWAYRLSMEIAEEKEEEADNLLQG